MYKKETLSRAETTYSDSFFVLRPQLCDSWCLLPAGTINAPASLFPVKDILLHTSVLLCLLYGYLPISWAGSVSFQAIKNFRITEMILCHLQKVCLPALFRWLSGHPAKHFCLTTITFHALAPCSCQKLRMDFALNRCHVPANGMQQWAIFNCLLFCLHVCLHCFLQICRLIWLFLTLVHVGVWQQACTQHLPEGK